MFIVTRTIAAPAILCGLLGLALPAAGSERVQIGVFEPGSMMALELDRLVPAARLVVEINGQPVTTPFGVTGHILSLTVPRDLRGVMHDVVVYAETAQGLDQIGIWEFETRTGAWDLFAAIQTEAGMRGSRTGQESYASGGGRIDFDLDDARFRGGLSFTLRETGPDRFEIGDWFLERRFAVMGQTGYARAGSHYYSTDGNLIDQGSRRGLSFRVAAPTGRHDSSLFALQTTQGTTSENLSGLGDADDRVAGVLTAFHPLPGSALRLSFAGFEGRAPDLPDGTAGVVQGQGIALSGPLGSRADFRLSADRTRWGAGSTEGMAYSAETNVGLLPPGDQNSLTLTLAYDRFDLDYYSPLNPNQITGEETVTVGLAQYMPDWDWALEAAVARTNVGGAASDPVDRLGRVSFQTTYAPQVFTGGFLNGTSFFFGAEMLQQDRIHTPAGAPAPGDNRIWQFSLGMDRFRPDHSFALLYTYDIFEDRTGSGQHDRIHGLEGLLSLTPSDRFSTSLGGDLELSNGVAGRYWQATAFANMSYDILPDKLTYGLELGLEHYEDTSLTDGRYVAQELAWNLHRNHAVVLSADWGRGGTRPALAGADGWVFGLALRSDFSVARYR